MSKDWASIQPVCIQVITFVGQGCCQGEDNPDCVAKVRLIYKYGLLPIVHHHLVQVPRLAVREGVCLDAPWVGLSLEVLTESNPPLEYYDTLINCHLLMGGVCSRK